MCSAHQLRELWEFTRACTSYNLCSQAHVHTHQKLEFRKIDSATSRTTCERRSAARVLTAPGALREVTDTVAFSTCTRRATWTPGQHHHNDQGTPGALCEATDTGAFSTHPSSNVDFETATSAPRRATPRATSSHCVLRIKVFL